MKHTQAFSLRGKGLGMRLLKKTEITWLLIDSYQTERAVYQQQNWKWSHYTYQNPCFCDALWLVFGIDNPQPLHTQQLQWRAISLFVSDYGHNHPTVTVAMHQQWKHHKIEKTNPWKNIQDTDHSGFKFMEPQAVEEGSRAKIYYYAQWIWNPEYHYIRSNRPMYNDNTFWILDRHSYHWVVEQSTSIIKQRCLEVSGEMQMILSVLKLDWIETGSA